MDRFEIKDTREKENHADHPADGETLRDYPPGAECTACGGRCCKEHGCVLAPEDLLRALSDIPPAAAIDSASASADAAVPERGMLLALLQDKEKGLFAIEYVSTPKGKCFYIRMRHKCYTFIGAEAMGECIALGENGCMFSMEERPRGGKMLKSSPDRRCVQYYTAERMCRDWMPYQELLEGIYREWFARMENDGTFDRCDEEYFTWIKEKTAKRADINR